MSAETPAERFQAAAELLELTVAMLRQRLRREHPSWTAAEVEARIDAWFAERPGAEHGDGDGEPIAWPRR